jgi:hypothetical protein
MFTDQRLVFRGGKPKLSIAILRVNVPGEGEMHMNIHQARKDSAQGHSYDWLFGEYRISCRQRADRCQAALRHLEEGIPQDGTSGAIDNPPCNNLKIFHL